MANIRSSTHFCALRKLHLILLLLASIKVTSQKIDFVVQTSHSAPIIGVIKCTDNLLVSRSSDGEFITWQIENGKIVNHSEVFDSTLNIQSQSAYSSDLSKYLLAGENFKANLDGKRITFYLNEQRQFKTMDERGSDIHSAEYNKEKNEVYIGLNNGDFVVLNAKSGRIKKRIKLHLSSINGILFDDQTNSIFTASSDRTIKQIDAFNFKLVMHYYGQSFKPNKLQFHPENGNLLIADEVGNISKIDFSELIPSIETTRISRYGVETFGLYNNMIQAINTNAKRIAYYLVNNRHKRKKFLKGSFKYRFNGRFDQLTNGYKDDWLECYNAKSNTDNSYFALNYELKFDDDGSVYSPDKISFIKTSTGKCRKLWGAVNKYTLSQDYLYYVNKESQVIIWKHSTNKRTETGFMNAQNLCVLGDTALLVGLNSGVTKLYQLDANGLVSKTSSVSIEHSFGGDLYSKGNYIIEKHASAINLYQMKSGKIKLIKSISIAALDFDLHPNNRTLAIIDKNHQISIINLDTDNPQPIYLITSNKGDLAFLNDKNEYFIPKQGLDFIGFTFDNQYVYPYQFDRYFNRPENILPATGLLDDQQIALINRAAERRLSKSSKLNASKLPRLDITAVYLEGNQLKYTGQVSNINEDVLFVSRINGVVYDTSSNLESINLPILSGNNSYELSCVSDGLESIRHYYDYESNEAKGNLYIISIGINDYQGKVFDLKYPTKDAKDIADAIKTKSTKNYQEVLAVMIENRDSEGVKRTLTEIKSKLNVHDDIILFFAGHGVLDESYDYYLACSDMIFAQPKAKGLPYAYIERYLADIPCNRKLLIMDACHSGEVDKDEITESIDNSVELSEDINFRSSDKSYASKHKISSADLAKAVFSDVNNLSGANIIASAAGAEFAAESDETNNGFFTKAFIDALNSKHADLNKDGNISLDELMELVEQNVQTLSNGKQTPGLRNENPRTYINF